MSDEIPQSHDIKAPQQWHDAVRQNTPQLTDPNYMQVEDGDIWLSQTYGTTNTEQGFFLISNKKGIYRNFLPPGLYAEVINTDQNSALFDRFTFVIMQSITGDKTHTSSQIPRLDALSDLTLDFSHAFRLEQVFESIDGHNIIYEIVPAGPLPFSDTDTATIWSN